MPIPRYRLRPEPPAVYEAVHWTGDNCAEVFAFLGLPHPEHDRHANNEEIDLPANWGGHINIVWPNDWILRNTTTGEFESYGDEDFQASFVATDHISAFSWAEIIAEHIIGGVTTVTIPFDDGGNWHGDVVLDLDQARVLRDMLNGTLEAAGDE